jgi:membrane dipeptidase
LRGAAGDESERARLIHKKAIVIDGHDHMGRTQDFADCKTGGVTAKIYMPINDGKYYDAQNRRIFPADPFDWTAKYLEAFERIYELEKRGTLRVVKRVADIEAAKRASTPGVILGNEGSLPLAGSMDTFRMLHDRGMRAISLFWPAGNHTRHVIDDEGRLTAFAKMVVEKADEIGVVVDTCHLAHTAAFAEALSVSKRPTIHSHGAGKFPRSWTLAEGDLDDGQIRAVANRGGVIGVHFCTYIKNLRGWNWQPEMDDLLDHVQYLVKIGGIDSVGIGADYFPYNKVPLGKPFQQAGGTSIEDRDWSKTYVSGLENISGMPVFTEGLVRRGFRDHETLKILGGNLLRVFGAVWS